MLRQFSAIPSFSVPLMALTLPGYPARFWPCLLDIFGGCCRSNNGGFQRALRFWRTGPLFGIERGARSAGRPEMDENININIKEVTVLSPLTFWRR